MVKVLIVSPLRIFGELHGRAMDVDSIRQPCGPPVELLQFSFGKDSAFNSCNEFGKRTDINADCFSA